jgi:hypothetical protein
LTVVLVPPDPLTVTAGDDPSPTVTVVCDDSVEGVTGSGLAEGPGSAGPVDGSFDGDDVLSVVSDGVEGDPAESAGPLVSGVAHAAPGMVPTAVPTPRATARAPTRPT